MIGRLQLRPPKLHRAGLREDVRFPDGRPQSGRERRTVRTARFRVCERMISNESPVREIRTLGSMSGERKRSRSGVRGTGGMALDAEICAPSTARPARLSSTLRWVARGQYAGKAVLSGKMAAPTMWAQIWPQESSKKHVRPITANTCKQVARYVELVEVLDLVLNFE